MAIEQSYTPPKQILEKYARLIVRFGLQDRDGKRPKVGSVVHFRVPEVARPLYFYLQQEILKAGFNPLGEYLPSASLDCPFEASFYANANKLQLEYDTETLTKTLIDTIDCTIRILAPTHQHELNDVQANKLAARTQATRKGTLYRRQKMNDGNLLWTIALYGTDQIAAEAGLTPKQYWNQISKACYLDEANPVATWKKIDRTVKKTAEKLTNMKIQSVHVTGPDADLTVTIGADRKWLSGGGNNIPSFEIFTSPTWQGTNGWIKLNQPLYREGKMITDIELWFKDGVVIKSKASKNHAMLKSMLALSGGDKLGEFSLTDGRLSRITHFMAETLYDENIGGKQGNTHIALGDSFRDTYNGTKSKDWKKADWVKHGFNSSVLHTDIISTTKRTVVATLHDGSEKVIYTDGSFKI